MNARGWHLLWALPLALVPAFFTLLLSMLEWCGVGGCSADQRIADPNRAAAVVWLLVTCAIAAFPVMVISWTPKRELRFMAALNYAAVVGIVGLLFIAPWRA
jgi:hypothetical protein